MGRLPAAAIPMAAPAMSDSEIGVLKHLASPNSSVTPWVALNTPPFLPPTSSPKTTVSPWAAMTSWIARLTAVMRLTSWPLGSGSGTVTAGPGSITLA